ncbi:MAG: DNA translocase FtsK 4TM domain-containing protein, partial [Actinomycetes bacterium]|nr:DNA translocase FtsK 4TM domain-containing protein [Actinomycetes bacterium]
MAKGTTKKRRTQKTGSRAQAKTKSAARASAPFLDERASADIAGIVLLTIGLALAVAVLSAHSGLVTDYISVGLAYAVGIGRYVVPLALIVLGISFFVPKRLEIVELRVGVGLALLSLAVTSLAALAAPRTALFANEALQNYGGYVGNGFSWVLLQLVGPIIAGILEAALGIIGLVVTGFSFSRLFESISERSAAHREERAQAVAQEAAAMPRTRSIAEGQAGGRGRRQAGADTFGTDSTLALQEGSNNAGAGAGGVGSTKAGRVALDDATVELKSATSAAAPRASEGFELPPFDVLKTTPVDATGQSKEAQANFAHTADVIVDTLATFDIPAVVVDWVSGPTVTLFKVDIAKGVRLNRVTALADDLALALAASTLRILAPIPGESLVGIEVPNARRVPVTLGDILLPAGSGGPLTLAIGRDVAGQAILRDLATMPHLLIAGTTGSGKSVAINAMIMSLIMRATPAEVRLILVDPKRVELTQYNGLPHLYAPVVTTPKDAASALAWAVSEMERRLKILQKAQVKNIGEYNQLFLSGKGPTWAGELPYLVIVIDELADLMMVAAKEVESSIVRLAQLARAVGMHLLVATQRPDASIVTPLIKTNIPNRIAFFVPTAIDSRVILDSSGAEQLTGLGDMLFSIPAWPKPKRIQGCFVSEEEINAAVKSLREQGEADLHTEIFETKVPG